MSTFSSRLSSQHRLRTLVAALGCVYFIPVCAQTAPAEPSTLVAVLQTVVVSGSRSEQLRDELPLSMDVLSARDMEDAQIHDIRDLAKGLPNLSVKRSPARYTVTGAGNATGRDANAGFNVRGQDGNRVLMLVDGVRLPRSYINGNNAFGRDAVSLDLLRRVELVRGPSSVLYGSDGLAGMVNFITYEPADFLRTSGGALKSVGGKFGFHYSSADRGGSLATTVAGQGGEHWQWLLTGTVRRAKGMGNMGGNDAANVDRSTPNPQSDQRDAVLGKLVYTPSANQKHVLVLEHGRKESDVDLLSSRAKAPLVAASVVAESAQQAQGRNRFTWDARYKVDSVLADQLQTVLTQQVSTAQDDGRTQRQDGGVRLRNTSYDEHAWQASVQASKVHALGAGWNQRLVYGLDSTRTDVTSWFGGSDPKPLPVYVPKKYFPDTRDTMTALYAQAEWSNGMWQVTPGVRYERFSLDVITQDGFAPPAPTPGKSLAGSNISPKLGVLYRINREWSVFAHSAAGFRAPNAAQVNGFTENPTPTTFVKLLPNPDLKPETSRNLELGWRLRSDTWQVDAAAFSSDFRDLIVDKKPLGGLGTAASPSLFQTVNVNRARIDGFELKAQAEWGTFAGLGWSSTLSYGQARGKDLDTGLPLNSVDPSKWVLGLKAGAARWEAGLDVTGHAAKTESDLDSPYLPKPATPPRVRQFTTAAATTVDVHLQVRPWTDVRVNVAVNNLGNRKYWLWSDVQGLAATSTTVDAYTQPGRHVSLSVVKDF